MCVFLNLTIQTASVESFLKYKNIFMGLKQCEKYQMQDLASWRTLSF